MPSSPITCHALDTLSGMPASNLRGDLTLLNQNNPGGMTQSETIFSAVTDQDGRIKDWTPNTEASLQKMMDAYKHGEKIPWSIKLYIGSWYQERNIECFWPEIEVKFFVEKGTRHYHVPVLVGPWTYTTYRGS